MSKPLVGITTYKTNSRAGYPQMSIAEAYLQALSQAGAIPIAIPSGLPNDSLLELLSHLDGVLFTGGGDIEPTRYNAIELPQVNEVEPARDRTEFLILDQVVQEGLPFLGICRGIQVVNVGLGGSLYADIANQLPDALKHDFYPGWPRHYLAHPVEVDQSSRLAQILGTTDLQVNSLHHQAIRQLAANLHPIAHSPDGLVEAVELPNHPFGLAVQWHPECLIDQASMSLFRAFVKAASQSRESI